MVDDHQQRMAHRHQGLLAAQSLDEAIELAAQVTVLLHAGAPSRLHQGRAQIGVALARAARQTLAAALFVAGTDARPTRQMRVALEVGFHLYANLGHDDLGRSWPKSRNTVQIIPGSGQLRAVLQIAVDLFGDAPVRRLQLFPKLQRFPQHEALVGRQAPVQRAAQQQLLLLEFALRQRGQLHRIGFALRQGPQGRPPADTQRVAGHLTELDVATLDHFLNAIGHRALLAHQTLAITREFAQLPNLRRRNETRLQQAMPQKISQPLRVFDIGLATTQSARVFGIDQNHCQRVLQNVEDRLPVNPRTLDRYVCAVGRLQPVAQAQQVVSHGREGANLLLDISQNQTRHQHLGVHVNTTTDFVNNFHRFSFLPAGRASSRKILLCKFTRARDIIRWYLGNALGSNYGSGSASSHRHQGATISSPRWRKVAYYAFSKINFSSSVVRHRRMLNYGAVWVRNISLSNVSHVYVFQRQLFSGERFNFAAGRFYCSQDLD